MGSFSVTIDINQPATIVEVTESTANLTVTFASREGPTPFCYRYAIEPNADGSRLTLDADISSAGLPEPLAHLDAVATRAFKQGMRRNLEELKHLVEQEAR
jgi:Polyketide cyclase / dehydrase and lipid transport